MARVLSEPQMMIPKGCHVHLSPSITAEEPKTNGPGSSVLSSGISYQAHTES
ncbi:hypothetical protein I79_010902 [Cricetulus griseus]|uniref:Uncharacterized protein n=1 Tax=Cricetulus griseus TaxID=10029 RepID=G3HJQ3_CRIGR|nr:hypothetical protein I79_010902 [Cricetulus griseus]